MKYEELAPTIAKHLTKEQAYEALPTKTEQTPAKVVEPGKEAIIEALKYVRFLGVEQIAKADAAFITMGPREISKRLAAEGHAMTPDQVKTLAKELRAVRVLQEVEEIEAKILAEEKAKAEAEAAAKEAEEAIKPTEPAPPPEEPVEPKEPVLEPKEPTK